MLNNNNLYYSYSLSIFKIIGFKDAKSFNNWKKFLKKLTYICNIENINFIINNKKIILKKIFYIIKQNLYIDKYMEDFFYILIEDNIFININIIYKYFIEIYKINNNMFDIVIYIRNKINKYNYFLIKKFIENKINISKNKIFNYIFIRNKNIISGFKIYVNDFVMDSSILNILYKIKFLKHKEYNNGI